MYYHEILPLKKIILVISKMNFYCAAFSNDEIWECADKQLDDDAPPPLPDKVTRD